MSDVHERALEIAREAMHLTVLNGGRYPSPIEVGRLADPHADRARAQRLSGVVATEMKNELGPMAAGTLYERARALGVTIQDFMHWQIEFLQRESADTVS